MIGRWGCVVYFMNRLGGPSLRVSFLWCIPCFQRFNVFRIYSFDRCNIYFSCFFFLRRVCVCGGGGGGGVCVSVKAFVVCMP